MQASRLLSNKGADCVTIDDQEFIPLWNLMNQIYGEENHLGNAAIRINPKGRITSRKLSPVHEYGIFFGKTEFSRIKKLPEKPEDKSHNYVKDENGDYYVKVNLRKQGVDSEGDKNGEISHRHFPIYYDEVSGEISVTKKLPIEIWPIDSNSEKRIWRRGKDVIEEMAIINDIWCENTRNGYQVYYRFRGGLDGKIPKTLWTDKKYSASEYGTRVLDGILGKRELFSYPKSPFATLDCIRVILDKKEENYVLDFFSGSGTTAHSVIKLQREDFPYKYILIEMGSYFDIVTKPRIQKVIYSDNWKNGKPQDKDGISQMFKYFNLESYEDTLNNLQLKTSHAQQKLLDTNSNMQEEYLLQYMLDVESRDQLLNIEAFKNPFSYKLNITENNELIPTNVDLVETFNYLIGLYVKRIQRNGAFKTVEGVTNSGDKALVIWRNLEESNNDDLNAFVKKMDYNLRDGEFDTIYVNGDNNLANLRQDEETWKVLLLEEVFFTAMFDNKDI